MVHGLFSAYDNIAITHGLAMAHGRLDENDT